MHTRAFAFGLSLAALSPAVAAAQVFDAQPQTADISALVDAFHAEGLMVEAPPEGEAPPGSSPMSADDAARVARFLRVTTALPGMGGAVEVEVAPDALATPEATAGSYGIPQDQVGGIAIMPVTVDGRTAFTAAIPSGYVAGRSGMIKSFAIGPDVVELRDDRHLKDGLASPSVMAVYGPGAMTAALCGANGLPCFESAAALHTYGSVSCSAVAIAPGWLLTAAYCVCDRKAGVASLGFDVADPYATTSLREVYGFGETPGHADGAFCGPINAWLNLTDDASPQDARAAAMAVAEARDLALVRTHQPLAYLGRLARTAIIAPDLAARIGGVYVAGFGAGAALGNGGRKTSFADVYDPDACAGLAGASPCLPDSEFAMTKTAQRADSCTGDSGARVFVMADGEPALLGIASRSASRIFCGAGGVCTRVADRAVIDWINRIVPNVTVIALATQIAAAHLEKE